MQTITIEGKEHFIYTTQDVANIVGCSIRTVELRCEKFFGKLKQGKKRMLSEEQKDTVCASIDKKVV